MRLTVKDGDLCINFADLLDGFGPDERDACIEQWACSDEIIERVAAQLIDGWTAGGSHGYTTLSCEDAPHTPLDKAIRRIALGSSAVAETQIKRLAERCKTLSIMWQQEMTKRLDIERKLWDAEK